MSRDNVLAGVVVHPGRLLVRRRSVPRPDGGGAPHRERHLPGRRLLLQPRRLAVDRGDDGPVPCPVERARAVRGHAAVRGQPGGGVRGGAHAAPVQHLDLVPGHARLRLLPGVRAPGDAGRRLRAGSGSARGTGTGGSPRSTRSGRTCSSWRGWPRSSARPPPSRSTSAWSTGGRSRARSASRSRGSSRCAFFAGGVGVQLKGGTHDEARAEAGHRRGRAGGRGRGPVRRRRHGRGRDHEAGDRADGRARGPRGPCSSSTRSTGSTARAAPGPTRPRAPRTRAEFCENGAKAVTEEATKRTHRPRVLRRPPDRGAARSKTDYWLGQQGRITEPMVLRARRHPLRADLVGRRVRADRPSTSTRSSRRTRRSSTPRARPPTRRRSPTSSSSRAFGTNNLPDCSNMCHESTSVALAEVIGIGKGSVTLRGHPRRRS